jgi:hypothetical protein
MHQIPAIKEHSKRSLHKLFSERLRLALELNCPGLLSEIDNRIPELINTTIKPKDLVSNLDTRQSALAGKYAYWKYGSDVHGKGFISTSKLEKYFGSFHLHRTWTELTHKFHQTFEIESLKPEVGWKHQCNGKSNHIDFTIATICTLQAHYPQPPLFLSVPGQHSLLST